MNFNINDFAYDKISLRPRHITFMDLSLKEFDKWFETITITEKMLLLNGFTKTRTRQDSDKLNDYVWLLQDDKGRNEYQIKVLFFEDEVSCIDIYHHLPNGRGEDHIHKCTDILNEFQQMLRLCGLNDFADNFKIQ